MSTTIYVFWKNKKNISAFQLKKSAISVKTVNFRFTCKLNLFLAGPPIQVIQIQCLF